MLRTCWPPCAQRGSPVSPPRRSARAVEKFQAVEHRLEYVATINGVEFYNDSKATNVDATAKAIAAFSSAHSPHPRRQRQGLRLHAASPICCASACKAVYTIGSAAAKIESHLRGVVSIHSCETLEKAVQCRGRRGAPRRRGAACAGLLQLRPV